MRREICVPGVWKQMRGRFWFAFDERKNKNHLLKIILTPFGKNAMINISNRYIERIYYMKCGDDIAGVHSPRHADGRNNERL